jgi:hypothetical protein
MPQLVLQTSIILILQHSLLNSAFFCFFVKFVIILCYDMLWKTIRFPLTANLNRCRFLSCNGNIPCYVHVKKKHLFVCILSSILCQR